jgi:hypothetical protein
MFLTGGLGNQLFQIAALVALTDNRSLNVDVVNGNPRGNQKEKPDSLNFSFGDSQLVPQTKRISIIARRVLNYCLRAHIKPRVVSSIFLPRILARFIASLLLSINLKELIIVRVCQGIGFDSRMKQSRFNTFYLGYFQSYKWLEMAQRNKVLSFELENSLSLVLDFKRLAEIERPLVVHVRLGDYLVENGFGTLDKTYYERALALALSTKEFGKIWLFSDDPQEALLRIPRDLGIEVRVMPDFGDSPAATLEAMRFGKGYVIGNSTFSWWGATLSYAFEPLVFYPIPWFKALDLPVDLVPLRWSSVDAF